MVFRYWLLTTCEGEEIFGVQQITVTCNITNETLASDNHGKMLDTLKVEPMEGSNIKGSIQVVEVELIGNDKTRQGYLKLYPNPTTSYIMLTLDNQPFDNGDFILNIYDQYGRLLKNKNLGNQVIDHHIDVGDLPGGMYIIDLTSTENNRWTKSFIKLD